ncbi:hypothetical protein [Burkholderia pyrrocinia]|uniref:hypothetical protein n=1 Tax=Burkholderia pyrrocinia TaxID=60550 RepID=UPI001BD17B29|nr:hypothetical protein [Burkholderia pyrrocinia]QVN21310.1 hypothetical protein JYG32_32850 [Burkholderia pyrrocinia]
MIAIRFSRACQAGTPNAAPISATVIGASFTVVTMAARREVDIAAFTSIVPKYNADIAMKVVLLGKFVIMFLYIFW